MNLTDARELAIGLMDRHGLTGWELIFDNAKMRAGVCHHTHKRIGLSRSLTSLYSVEQVTDTVLHEIAHALVGARHGHNRVWRATALRIGSTGNRCVSEAAPKIEGNWEGVCPAGHRTTGHRRPIRVRSCPDCSPAFDLAAVFTWSYRGQPAPMLPAYRAELARLQKRAPAR
ncbi:SprT-like domain-containing protein [Actinoplanes sp. CA-015351]|uniref:SprT-like domain-containing protein n=1 Tax=Actinoplanes sp. CA-015351 TaxID=3239897 RepID=UPI003D9925F8